MDTTDDRLHSTLYGIVKEAGAPDYVLDSEVMDKEAADRLPDSLFADRANRKFPLDSRASVWTSAAYWAKTASDEYANPVLRQYVGDVIMKAADAYGIRDDVERAVERIRRRPAEKRAEDDESNYGWPAERKYPMFDEDGVKLANEYFADNAMKYPAAIRREIASRIFAKSAEYGIEPSEAVRIESGNGFESREKMAYALVDRARSVSGSDPELARQYGRMARAVAETDDLASTVEKLASVLSMADEYGRLDDRYGSRYLSPMQVLHGRSVKEAQAFLDDAVDLDGTVFSARKLAQLPISVFTNALGDGFAAKVKMAEDDKGEDKDNGGYDDDDNDEGKDSEEAEVVKCDKSDCPDGMCVVSGMPAFDLLPSMGLDFGGPGDLDGMTVVDDDDSDGDGMDGFTIDPRKLMRELSGLGSPGKKAVVRQITYYVG